MLALAPLYARAVVVVLKHMRQLCICCARFLPHPQLQHLVGFKHQVPQACVHACCTQAHAHTRAHTLTLLHTRLPTTLQRPGPARACASIHAHKVQAPRWSGAAAAHAVRSCA